MLAKRLVLGMESKSPATCWVEKTAHALFQSFASILMHQVGVREKKEVV